MGGIWQSCASGECLQPFDGFRFLLDPERVVEFVEEAAEGDAQRQLDDLGFAEMAAEPGEESIGNAVRVLPGGDRVFDDELVALVEFRVVAVIENAIDTGGRDPLDDQKRRVMRDAIIAGVQLRDRDDRQFQSGARDRVDRGVLAVGA